MDTVLMQQVLPYAKRLCKQVRNRNIVADTIAWLIITKDSVYKNGLAALDLEKDSKVNKILAQMPFPEVREFYQCLVKAFTGGMDRTEAAEYTRSWISKQGPSEFSSYLCCLIYEGLVDIYEIGKLRPKKKREKVLTAQEIELLLKAFSKSEKKPEPAVPPVQEKQSDEPQDVEAIAQEEADKAESARLSRGFEDKLWSCVPPEWKDAVQKIYMAAEEKREIKEEYQAMMDEFDDDMKFPKMETNSGLALDLQKMFERIPSEPLWNMLNQLEDEEIEIILMYMPFTLRKRMYMGIYPESRQKHISASIAAGRFVPAFIPKEEKRMEVLKRVYESVRNEKRKMEKNK